MEFQWASSILKDDTVKVLHSICQQIWKTQQWPQHWKRPVFIPIPKKGNAKYCSNFHMIVLISLASKVMLKLLQAKLQQYMNQEFPDVQTRYVKAEEPENKLPASAGSQKKQEDSRKTSTSASLTTLKLLTVCITINVMAIEWGNHGNSDELFSWAQKSLRMVTATMKLKEAFPLEEKL